MANIQDLYQHKFGRFGSTVIASTTEYDGKWASIYIAADAKFDSETTYETTNAPAIDGDTFKHATAGSAITIPANTWLHGEFTKIKLHSGTIIAYKNNTATAATT